MKTMSKCILSMILSHQHKKDSAHLLEDDYGLLTYFKGIVGEEMLAMEPGVRVWLAGLSVLHWRQEETASLVLSTIYR